MTALQYAQSPSQFYYANGQPRFETFASLLGRYSPFADSAYIFERLHAAYERRLAKIAPDLPAAGQLLDAVQDNTAQVKSDVLSDTTLRSAVQHALRQIVTGEPYGFPLPVCNDIFNSALEHVESGMVGSLIEGSTLRRDRLGPRPWHSLIWDEDGPDEVIGRGFRFIVEANYGESLVTPSASELAVMRDAMALLDELVPELSRSALRHTIMVAIFPSAGGWKGKASSSQYRVSGTVFLNRDALRNPWWVAEHLLHESLHQKLYDFRHGHLLLTKDSSDTVDDQSTVGRTVHSVWNLPGLSGLNFWDTHRSLAAFHVYVHLAVLTTLAEKRVMELEPRYGPLKGAPPVMTSSRLCFDRAQYLEESLRKNCWDELGTAGHWLIDWLGSIIHAIDPCPPPPGSYIHLLLDRYTLEINHVAQVVPSPQFADVLERLIEFESRRTSMLLDQIGRLDQLELLESSLAIEPGEG